MKRRFQRVIALACALLFGATIFAGIPGYTAKAGEQTVTRPNRVVYEGDILSKTGTVLYVKPGTAEEAYTKIILGGEDPKPFLIHGNIGVDYRAFGRATEYSVRAVEEGSNSYILRMQIDMFTGEENTFYCCILEPYTYIAPEETIPSESGTESPTATTSAPVYVYVEPAWLTAWKGLLVGIDKQIADAKAGDTVILDLGEYYNISNARMQQIAEKNDVTFILNMTYDKVNYSLTIKPGTEIDLSCDWYGPLKLLSMFPYEVVE